MSSLSVVIITRNEEANLRRCLESVQWADEIIVMDSHSTDRTVDIATSFGAQVHTVEWRGFGAAKQAGLERAKGEWVLSIDADEEVTPALREEIRQAVNGNGNLAGYTIPRRTSFLGRWIRHCGWYPDPVLRLFRRSRGRFDDALVHERVVVDGPTARLSGELLHYSYPSLESYFEKFNRYTTLGAEEAFARGEQARWYHFIGKPLMCFIKHYVLKKGFLDGIEGLVISVLSSCSVFVKYAKLRDLQRRARERTT